MLKVCFTCSCIVCVCLVECKVSWSQSGLIVSLVLNGGETIIILKLKQRVYNNCVAYAGGKRHAQFLKVKKYVLVL